MDLYVKLAVPNPRIKKIAQTYSLKIRKIKMPTTEIPIT